MREEYSVDVFEKITSGEEIVVENCEANEWYYNNPLYKYIQSFSSRRAYNEFVEQEYQRLLASN